MGREIGTLIILHFEVHILCIYKSAHKLSSILKNERKSKHFIQTSCFIFLFYYIPQKSNSKFITKPCLSSKKQSLLPYLNLFLMGKMYILHIVLVIKCWLILYNILAKNPELFPVYLTFI